MASTPTHGAMSPERAAAILGVAPTASASEIRAAYNGLARLAHPDRFAGGSTKEQTDAAARFIRLTEAYEVLRLTSGVGGGRPDTAGSGMGGTRGAGGTASGARPGARPPHVDDNPAPRTSGSSHRAAASGDYGPPDTDDGIWVVRPDHAVREATRQQRAIVRGVVVVIASLLALLFSSNAIGLSPGSFGIPPSSSWYLPVMLIAESVCLAAVATCAGYAASGVPWCGRVGVTLVGLIVLAFIVSALITAPFTFSTLVFTSFGAFVTGSPFLALLLIGRSSQDARDRRRRTADEAHAAEPGGPGDPGQPAEPGS